ncbi:MAG TPA: NAD-dependent epimerase/dehydratase family protein, partial [Dehalococcoidia bacterium]|nr:NAD-dependent epimerase/dehydratase family protein [Dehalococcoidia bacterium]
MNRIDPFIEFEMIAFDNSALWLKLKGAHILITGGTGFFGKWILEFLSFINSQLGLDLTVSVLSRSPDHFAKSMPHLFQDHFLNLVKGDVRTFNPSVNSYSHIIHGAAPANLLMDIERPHDMFDVIVSGTKNIL